MKKLNVLFSPPDITEEEIAEVVDTLKSGWITTGPKTKLFQKQLAEFCHTSKAVCLNSATACLEMALRVLGIGPGDEVITTAYTYTASASVVCHVGAKLVLIDTQKDSYEMDYEKLEQAITENTKAIISVDLAGIIGKYEKLFSIAERKKALFHPVNKIQERMGRIAVLADAAHALGAEKDGKRCGEIADFTSFSFHAVKNLTTAEGGALVWRDIEGIDNEALYKQFMLFSLHGQSKDALAKTQLGAWEYDIVEPYFKCNMTDIMASIGLAQLKRYELMLNRRHEIIARYDAALTGDGRAASMRHIEADARSSGHLYLLRLDGKSEDDRNAVIGQMAERGVACNVHYKPLPMFTAYRKLGFDISDFPNAYEMYRNEITLPLHTCLTEEQIAYVTDSMNSILAG